MYACMHLHMYVCTCERAYVWMHGSINGCIDACMYYEFIYVYEYIYCFDFDVLALEMFQNHKGDQNVHYGRRSISQRPHAGTCTSCQLSHMFVLRHRECARTYFPKQSLKTRLTWIALISPHFCWFRTAPCVWWNTHLLCWVLILWYGKTLLSHNEAKKLSRLMRGSTSQRSDWGNIASIQLFSSPVKRQRNCAKTTVPIVTRRWATHNPSETSTCLFWTAPWVWWFTY